MTVPHYLNTSLGQVEEMNASSTSLSNAVVGAAMVAVSGSGVPAAVLMWLELRSRLAFLGDFHSQTLQAC